jgi:phosphoglucosamine mutase
MPAGHDARRLKIVIDCANGAGYKVAPRILAELGAEIVPIGCSPNGRNINDGCGSTKPELLQLTDYRACAQRWASPSMVMATAW